MRMILIRHGETEWNLHKMTQGMSDSSLSDLGTRQAQRLALRIQRMNVEAVYSSPLQRAFDTASFIANESSLPVHIDDSLREIHFGHWEGLTFAQITKRYPESLEKWKTKPQDCRIPGSIETISDVHERSGDFVRRMKSKHENDCIAVVTHSVVSKILLIEALDIAMSKMHSFQMDNASMSIIEYYEEQNVVRLLNDISHLSYLKTVR